MILKLIVWGCS